MVILTRGWDFRVSTGSSVVDSPSFTASTSRGLHSMKYYFEHLFFLNRNYFYHYYHFYWKIPPKEKGKRKKKALANPDKEPQPQFEVDTPAAVPAPAVVTEYSPVFVTQAEVHREVSRDLLADSFIGGRSQLVNVFRIRWDVSNAVGALDGKHVTICWLRRGGSQFYN